MTPDLLNLVEQSSRAAVSSRIRAFADELARAKGADAVLFYGSNLRSGTLDGIVDLYVLTPGPVERGIWPTVSYHEQTVDGIVLRAKVATMRSATFRLAADDRTPDTTIWARFVQPAALVWSVDAQAARRTYETIAAAAVTAGRYAALLGPARGTAEDFWAALFAATYSIELRVERGGRYRQVIDANRRYFETLLPLAWAAGGIAFNGYDGQLRPMIQTRKRTLLRNAWRFHRLAAKPINVVRLVRAAFTFEGAARYGAWKIERHTGVVIPITPWRERHPVLAAPGVFWRVWRSASR